MNSITHSLGRFGRGKLENGRLVLICNDNGSISRVYDSSRQRVHSHFGCGWQISIPDCARGIMRFKQGRLESFTDKEGKAYAFLYANDRLSCVISSEGILSYDYNADGMLTRVRYPQGETVSISYRDIYFIHDISITDKDGAGVCAVSYIDGFDGKVEHIYEYTYKNGERVERCYTDASDPRQILTLSHRSDILIVE